MMKNTEPWNFCETPKEKCTMNYCDDNGCQNRKRNYVDGNDLIPDVMSRLSRLQVLNYEIHSHWLARWIGFDWGQVLMSKYFAWKVRRKYNRYLVSLEERDRYRTI